MRLPTALRLASLLGLLAMLVAAGIWLWQARTSQAQALTDGLTAAEKTAAGPAGPATAQACAKVEAELRPAVEAIADDDDRALDASRGLRALAQCAMHRGEVDTAVADFRRAIGRRAEFAPLHADLAMALSKQGQHLPAQRAALLGVQLEPDRWVAHRQYARVLDAAGSHGTAHRAYERALQLAPADQVKRLQDEINRFRQRNELQTLESRLADELQENPR